MNLSRNHVMTAACGIIFLCLAPFTTACSPSPSPSSGNAPEAPAQAPPKTLAELTALEDRRDYLEARICWRTTEIGTDFRQIIASERWGVEHTAPGLEGNMRAIKGQLGKLHADRFELQSINRRIDAAHDSIPRPSGKSPN